MDRRGFLKAFIGVSGGSVLPADALSFLAKTETISDADFISGVELNFTNDELTLNLDDFYNYSRS